MSTMKKKEGFEGQKSIVLPEVITNELSLNIISSDLYVTDIGFYPDAQFHFRKRNKGAMQNILIYCINGQGWFEVDGKRQIVQSNQYFIIPAHSPHAYGADPKIPWSIYWLHFLGNKAKHFIDRPNQVLELDVALNERYADRILLFEEIYRNLEMGYSIDNLDYASICLMHMLGSFRYLSQFRKIKEVSMSDPISRSIEYMRSNLSNKIRLEEVAAYCGFSLSHFCLLFKKKTHRTPSEYLTHLRIQKACQLLDYSTLKIKEVAQQCGFDDPFYFSKVFTKVMDRTPSIYRKTKKV